MGRSWGVERGCGRTVVYDQRLKKNKQLYVCACWNSTNLWRCGGNKSVWGGVKGGGERQKWVGEQRVGAGETEKRGERVVEATSKEQEVREKAKASKTHQKLSHRGPQPHNPTPLTLFPALASSSFLVSFSWQSCV